MLEWNGLFSGIDVSFPCDCGGEWPERWSRACMKHPAGQFVRLTEPTLIRFKIAKIVTVCSKRMKIKIKMHKCTSWALLDQ